MDSSCPTVLKRFVSEKKIQNYSILIASEEFVHEIPQPYPTFCYVASEKSKVSKRPKLFTFLFSICRSFLNCQKFFVTFGQKWTSRQRPDTCLAQTGATARPVRSKVLKFQEKRPDLKQGSSCSFLLNFLTNIISSLVNVLVFF